MTEQRVRVEVFYADPETGKERLSRGTWARRNTARDVAKDVAAIEAEGLGPAVVRVRGIKFTPEGYQAMEADYRARHPEEET